MAKINLSIITPERTIFNGDVDQVTMMTASGEITVLPHHLPLVSALAPGELSAVRNGEVVPMVIAGGFVEVLGDERSTAEHGTEDAVTRVAVLADDALRVEEMDIAAIEAARERARKALTEQRHADDVGLADAATSLQRELARLRVAQKYRHGSHGGAASQTE